MKHLITLIFLFVGLLVGVPVAEAANFVWPVSGPITSYFNPPHNGIDIAVPCGTPVVSSKWGTVTFSGWDDTGYGWRIDIDDGEDRALYAHLSQMSVGHGQWVEQGQLVGHVGSSGWSTGCHLHYEIHWVGGGWGPVNPLVALP